MKLTDTETFRRDGYVVLRGLASDAAIDACLEEILVIFAGMARRCGVAPAASSGLAELSTAMTALFRTDMDAYLAAAKLAQHAVALHRMGCDETLIAALRGLGLADPVISTRPVLFFMADALKVPGGYHKSPPHQDWRSVQGSLDSVVVWVPFSRADRDNYPLEVIRGSHRLGLLASIDDVFAHRVDEAALPPDPFMPLNVGRGDAVVFSTFLVHRTGETGGPLARLAASFRFNNITEPTFVERRYPNPYVYRPDMTLLTPGFPRTEEVRAVFDETGRARAKAGGGR